MVNGEEYRQAISALGMSQAKASTFFGFTTRQSRRIAKTTAALTEPAEKLLRVMLHFGITPAMVVALMGTPVLPAKKPVSKKIAAVAPAK